MGRPHPRMSAFAALAASAVVITTTAVAADYDIFRPPLPMANHESALVGRYHLKKGAPTICPLVAEVTAPLKGWRNMMNLHLISNVSDVYVATSSVEAGVFSFDGVACQSYGPLSVVWTDRQEPPERTYGMMDFDQAVWRCGEDVQMNGIFVDHDVLDWVLYANGPNGLDCTYIAYASAPEREEVSAGGTVPAPNTTTGGGVVILNPQYGTKEGALPAPEESASCFPAAATVELADGSTAALGALPAGSTVRVGAGAHSDVFGWSHRQTGGRHAYVRLTHGDGAAAAASATRDLLLSPGHLVYANGVLVPARDVVVGDALATPGTGTGVSVVVAVGTAVAVGKVNPHTLHGDVVVDGVRVSTYKDALHPSVAHALLAPARAAYRAGLSAEPLGRLLYNGVPGWGRWRA